MAKDVIARDVAEEEVQGWCEQFKITLDLESRERIVTTLMAGRITFDEKNEAFSIQLRKPIHLDNGEIVDSLKIEEADARQIKEANKVKDEFEKSLRLLSSISGQPLGVLDRIKQKDLLLLGDMFNFFG